MPNVAWIVSLQSPELAEEVAQLRGLLVGSGLVDAGEPTTEADLDAADLVVVWTDHRLPQSLADSLARPEVVVLLAGPSLALGDPDGVLSEAAGLGLGASSPRA